MNLLLVIALTCPLGCDFSPASKYETPHDKVPIKSEPFLPMGHLVMTQGIWYAELHISKDDLKDLPPTISRAACLCLDDQEKLRQLQATLKVRASGGDLATVTSKIAVYNNGKRAWESGIVLSNGAIGLQSSTVGYAQVENPSEVLSCFTHFHPCSLTKPFSGRGGGFGQARGGFPIPRPWPASADGRR
jgi:hypothetical protein